MPPPTLLPFLREILPDKNILIDYLSRHKLIALLFASHIVFFFLLLFMSEQNIQKENTLIEMKRVNIATTDAMSKLASCKLDLDIIKQSESEALEVKEFTRSDYRQLSQSLLACQVALEDKYAAPTQPAPKTTTQRPTAHPPRRISPTNNTDYQQMLEGL